MSRLQMKPSQLGVPFFLQFEPQTVSLSQRRKCQSYVSWMQLYWCLLVLLQFIVRVNSFDFRGVSVAANSYQISTTTAYTFIFDRTTDNTFSYTAYDTTAVPTGGTITITFPSEYTLTSSPTCTSVTVDSVSVTGFSCATNGLRVTVSSALNSLSSQFVRNVIVILSGIKNPSPALTTGTFGGTIGDDVSVPAGSGISLRAGSFASCSVTFSPNSLNQLSSMYISVTPTNELPQVMSFTVKFLSGRRWLTDISTTSVLPVTSSMTCVSRSSTVSTGIQCTGNSNDMIITASSALVASTTSQVIFSVESFTSPPTAQPTDQINILSYEGAYQLEECTVAVTGLQPNPYGSLTATPLTTMRVNSLVGIRFTFILADTINQVETFQISFPAGLTLIYSSVTGTGDFGAPSATSSAISVPQNTLILKTYLKASSFIIIVNSIRAPSSVKVSGPITVNVLRNGQPKMRGTVTLQAVASVITTRPPTLTVTTVNAATNYMFEFTTTDPITGGGLIKITLPTAIRISLSSSRCATLIGVGFSSTPVCTANVLENSITFSSLLTDPNAIIQAGAVTLQVTGLINPPSIQPTATSTIELYYTSSTDTLVSTGSFTAITATLGTIGLVDVTPSSFKVLESPIDYTVTFRNSYQIPVGSSVKLTFPSDVPINTASLAGVCKFALDGGIFSSATCTSAAGTGSSTVITVTGIALLNPIPASSTVSIKISQVFTNPDTTRIVIGFEVVVIHSNGFSVQSRLSGITVQMVTPASLNFLTLTRTNNKNSASSVYTLSFSQLQAVPAAGLVALVTLPAVLEIKSPTVCTDSLGTVLQCSVSNGNLKIVYNKAVSSLVSIQVLIDSLINPPSFKPPSTALNVKTYISSELAAYSQSSTIPSGLVNTEPSVFQSVAYQFNPLTLDTPLTVSITFRPSNRLTPSEASISLAPSMVEGTLVCDSLIGFTGTCTIPSSSSLNVQGSFSLATMTVVVSGFRSPTFQATDFTTLTTFDANGFTIDHSSIDIAFTIACTLPCKTCPSSNKQTCTSCYSNTAVTAAVNYLSTLSQCLSQCSAGTYASTLLCLPCDSKCLTCSQSSTNCLTCDTTKADKYFWSGISSAVSGSNTSPTPTCLTSCPIYYYPDATSTCTRCITPCNDCTSAANCRSCLTGFYFYNLQCLSNCPAGTTIANSATNTCDNCASICATCTENINTCTACSASSALYQGSCVAVCPTPLVINAGQCSSCSSTCATCSVQATRCTSCVQGSALPLLYIDQCLALCPQYYYSDTVLGRCNSCAALNIGCTNCESSSKCITCDTGLVFLAGACYTSTPAGYLKNQQGIAIPCEGECATCLVLVTSCTSCKTLSLSGSSCVANCPLGTVSINKECQRCTSPCDTCQTLLTSCLSCLSLTPAVFLTGKTCQTTCPAFTFPNSATRTCDLCTTPCQTCSSATICLTCVANFNLQNTNCVGTCSAGTIGVNRVCTRCTDPCATCSGLPTTCLTCDTTYYLVQSSQTCSQICPTGLYPDIQTQTCTGCKSPCQLCSLTSTTCTSCVAGSVLYNNGCASRCPDGTYLSVSQCISCPSKCSTCSSPTVCLSCVFPAYFYLNNCLDACPSTFPVVNSLGQCTKCSNSNCIVCDSKDICSQCSYPSLLHLGTCLAKCPTGYVASGSACAASSDVQANSTLSSTLSSSESSLFPVPVSISSAFFGVACLMSKFQQPATDMVASMFAITGALEIVSIGMVIGFYLTKNSNEGTLLTKSNLLNDTTHYESQPSITNQSSLAQENQFNTSVDSQSSNNQPNSRLGASIGNRLAAQTATATTNTTTQIVSTSALAFSRVELVLIYGALGLYFLLNIIAFIIQSCYFLPSDAQFSRWAVNASCSYWSLSVVSLLISFKIRNLLFCRLFGLYLFSAKMRQVSGFRYFNVFIFIGFLSTGAMLYAVVKLFISYIQLGGTVTTAVGMAYIDCLILLLINLVLGVLTARRGKSYFEQTYQDGIVAHKRINVSGEWDNTEDFKTGINNKNNLVTPLTHETEYYTYTNVKPSIMPFSDTSEAGSEIEVVDQGMQMSMNYDPIQALEPSFHSLSRLSLFSHKQVSVQFQPPSLIDQSVNQVACSRRQVSIQNSILPENHEISIQFQAQAMEHSAQMTHIPGQDASLQFGGIQVDCGQQMDLHEEDYGVQAEPGTDNISIQYSAKPIYQVVEANFNDFDPSHTSTHEEHRYVERNERSVNRPFMAALPQSEPLPAQLQIDVNEKLTRRQAEADQEANREVQLKQQGEMERLLGLLRERAQPQNDTNDFGNETRYDDFHNVTVKTENDHSEQIVRQYRKLEKEIDTHGIERIDAHNKSQQSEKTYKDLMDMIRDEHPKIEVITQQRYVSKPNHQQDFDAELSLDMTDQSIDSIARAPRQGAQRASSAYPSPHVFNHSKQTTHYISPASLAGHPIQMSEALPTGTGKVSQTEESLQSNPNFLMNNKTQTKSTNFLTKRPGQEDLLSDSKQDSYDEIVQHPINPGRMKSLGGNSRVNYFSDKSMGHLPPHESSLNIGRTLPPQSTNRPIQKTMTATNLSKNTIGRFNSEQSQDNADRDVPIEFQPIRLLPSLPDRPPAEDVLEEELLKKNLQKKPNLRADSRQTIPNIGIAPRDRSNSTSNRQRPQPPPAPAAPKRTIPASQAPLAPPSADELDRLVGKDRKKSQFERVYKHHPLKDH